MPKIDHEKMKKAFTALKKKKVFNFPTLLLLLNCSVRTGRSNLEKWKAYSSYNHNARFYTLPGVPHFDENGLWWYRDIYFSKYGTLKNTVVHLINASSSGLTGDQLGKIVGISPSSFLHHFRDTSGIQREKQGGVYVYFSDDEDRFKQQTTKRLENPGVVGPISDADAILILVSLINHHEITVEDMAKLPEVIEKRISPLSILEYLKQHGLGKKTPNSNL